MTTKFIVFSDFHSHNFAYGSEQVEGTVCRRPGYYNSRFLQGLQILEEIKEASRGSDAILFGGDLFHQRGSVSTDVLMGTYNCVQGMNTYAPIHLIPGNHDYANRDGCLHSLIDLHDETNGVFVHDSSWSIQDFGNVRIWFVPYMEHKSNFLSTFRDMEANREFLDRGRNRFNLLVLHAGIQGGIIGSDFVLSSANDLSLDELPSWMNLTLIGHFHKHQKLKENVYFIGSSHQHNWGDANDKRGYLTVSIENDGTYSVTQTETTKASRFIVTDKPVECRKIDFVKSKKESLSSKDFGNPKVFENIQVVEEEDTEEFKPPSWAVEDVLASWVLAKGVPDDYLEVGKQLIKEVL